MAESTVRFNRDIRPILQEHCVACHGGVKQASGVSFIYRERALAAGDSGAEAIVPYEPQASYLLDRVTEADPDFRMPPAEHGPPLAPTEVDRLTRWIEQGAAWEEHWSFVPPERSVPPPSGTQEWDESRVDRFVLAKMREKGLSPSPEAPRAEWLRRASFDLTGLPPSPELQQAFDADLSARAYQRVVDQLLASPHFGERWASLWLDLARYADSMGYEKDPHRDAWPYRDWLIRAFNSDMPYDQFVTKQLAGDLLPEPALDDMIATAFSRNTQTNTEGGTDDEEFRTAAVLDRVSTTWQTVGGLTFGCAQCHSHPYDPIENQEYYRFTAFFNTTRDEDTSEDLPVLAVPNDRRLFDLASRLDRAVRNARQEIFEMVRALAESGEPWSGLHFAEAHSTGQTRLELSEAPGRGGQEVHATGTISKGSRYTLTTAAVDQSKTVTALRIDASPEDPAGAERTPEVGFVLTKLELQLQQTTQKEWKPVRLAAAYGDDPQSLFQAAYSLADDDQGWASYARIYRRQWAVFLLEEPLRLAPGDKLRLILSQDRSAVGDIPMVLKHSTYSLSSDRAWAELLQSNGYQELRRQLETMERERGAIESVALPIMREGPAGKKRKSFAFERGNWLDKGDEVTPGVPHAFPGPGVGDSPTRLDLARWFSSPQHPLTARVQVNRVWEQLFGRGLVRTTGDFGSSGAAPTHPELLDDLAVRFSTDMNWSLKNLLRGLVLSATYRQDARVSQAKLARDPGNLWLARGSRRRLSAEMLRDQALAVSGLLAPRLFGPPVMPPQPEGVWKTVYSGDDWETDVGSNRYRRAIYTYWKRTSPYPAMLTFDAPRRDVCTTQRIATNTPLQALALLNDPAVFECSQALAERMQAEGGSTPESQVGWVYEQVTGVPAGDRATRELLSLYSEAAAHRVQVGEEASSDPDAASRYARVIVANTVLNIDAAVTR